MAFFEALCRVLWRCVMGYPEHTKIYMIIYIPQPPVLSSAQGSQAVMIEATYFEASHPNQI